MGFNDSVWNVPGKGGGATSVSKSSVTVAAVVFVLNAGLSWQEIKRETMLKMRVKRRRIGFTVFLVVCIEKEL